MRHLVVLLSLALAVAVTGQEHFIDVRALVKDTIDAIKEVPQMMNQNNQTATTSGTAGLQSDVATPEPAKVVKARSDVYDSLLKLPGDIMSQLARDAGFVDEKTQKAQAQQAQQKEDKETREEEMDRVEKKKEEEESYSFKTVDDMKEAERRQAERATLATKPRLDDNDDIFSISKLISATGNAIREAQAAQKPVQPQADPMITLPPLVPLPPAPLQMPALQMPAISQPATEIMYRPVTRDGKTVYEQVVVLKDANGSVKLLPNTLLPQLPVEAPKPLEIKTVNKEGEFLAPTFPPAVNLFDQLTSTTEASTTTTTAEEPTTTTEEVIKPRRKSLPRRKIQYLEKKAKDMHSRQFGAKTVQMSDPIEIQAQEEQEPVNVLQKEGNLRVHAINSRRKSRKPRVVKVELEETVETPDEEDVTEPPKKRRKTLRKHKKVTAKKEIRKLPDLYDEQWKTQVAPSVSPPSENFAEQFDGVDEVQEVPSPKRQEPQNDTPMNDPIEQRSSKVQMLTKEQEEELINKEIRKRVMHRIRLSKLKATTTTEEPTTTTTEEPTTTETVEKVDKVEKFEEEEEESSADALDDEELEEEEVVEEDEEEDLTTTTTTTTTTEAPTTRAHRARKNKKRAVVTKKQCLNLRSFSRQFLFDTVEEFAKEHCYFIENYYPALTCARSHVYVAKCQRWLKEKEE